MSSELLPLAIVLAGTGVGAAIDLRTGRMPNALTMALAAAGLALAAAGFGRVGLPAALAGCSVGLALMLPGYLFGATGGGDVKLFAAAGTVLGPAATLSAFLFALMAGGALALIVAAYRRRVYLTVIRSVTLVMTAGGSAPEIEGSDAGNRFAYAPAITVGVMIAAIFV